MLRRNNAQYQWRIATNARIEEIRIATNARMEHELRTN